MSVGEMEDWVHDRLSSHLPVQASGGAFALVTHSAPIGYLIAACIAAIVTEWVRYRLRHKAAMEAFALHARQTAADVKAWKDSGLNPPIGTPTPSHQGDTDEFKP